MTDRFTELGVRLRAFQIEDIPAVVDIGNRIWPDDPSTVEEEEYNEKTYPQENPRLRLIVETPRASSSAWACACIPSG